MIEKKLKEFAVGFDQALDRLLPTGEEPYAVLCEAMRYSAMLGGKRLRPFLIEECYRLCGGKGDHAIHFEVAIECIHTYSLIHDDLPCMDNDDMRRGKPSCHKQFGEADALLAGDALLTEAFSIAAATEQIDSGSVLRALSVLSRLAGVNGMIGGQVVDLLSEGKSVGEDTLKLICSLKTGALIKAACTIGCILAGANESQIEAAQTYAESVGLAFQIVDDILDCIGDEQKLGKPIHSDEINEKSTFVTVYGIENCKQRVRELTDRAKASLSVFGEKAETLCALADYLCQREY